jgi:CheY-like chemotaxis protein
MTATRPTVLVIEDDLIVSAMLVRVLSPAFNVSVSVDGEAALWRFETGERFDVVICDVHLPRMDGPAVVEHLRRMDADQARRVVVMTGDAQSTAAAQLSNHFTVEKPFHVPELRELIGRVSTAAREGYFPTS